MKLESGNVPLNIGYAQLCENLYLQLTMFDALLFHI